MEGGEMRMELDQSSSPSPVETEAWGKIPGTSCLEGQVGGPELGTIGVPPGF